MPLPTPLAQQMAHTTGIFQALFALPVFIGQGWFVLDATFFYYWLSLEPFARALFCTLMSAAVIFVVLVQRSVWKNARRGENGGDAGESARGNSSGGVGGSGIGANTQLLFECVKSGAATGVWVWLLVDAITDGNPNYADVKWKRVVITGFSGVLLLFVYYPTLVYAYVCRRGGVEDGPVVERVRDGEAEERQPLLGDR